MCGREGIPPPTEVHVEGCLLLPQSMYRPLKLGHFVLGHLLGHFDLGHLLGHSGLGHSRTPFRTLWFRTPFRTLLVGLGYLYCLGHPLGHSGLGHSWLG